MTHPYALIGKSLRHSYSKPIHALLGNDRYELLELSPEEVVPFLRNAGFLGLNVTIPYKETVIPYCTPDEAARKIGSVNTIVNRNGQLYGYNTDYFGFSLMAKFAGITFDAKKVIILGSGGTSKTASAVIRDSGAREIVVVSRNGADNYGNINRHYDAEIIVNATPVGMFPHNGDTPLPGNSSLAGNFPLSLDNFLKLSAVIDVIYNPLRTRLLLDAKERGLCTAGGLSMLIAQALAAHNLFFDITVTETDNLAQIQKILPRAEMFFSNIVLVGMPGCGKTTAGRELARLYNRDFIDTDFLIEQRTGRKVPDIITGDGEPAFRVLEREAVAEAAAQSNRVIATGGGSVLLKENRDALLQNGIVIFLDSPPELLATGGRPLSQDLPALYRQRLPLYESMCHHKIAVDPDTVVTVHRIQEALS